MPISQSSKQVQELKHRISILKARLSILQITLEQNKTHLRPIQLRLKIAIKYELELKEVCERLFENIYQLYSKKIAELKLCKEVEKKFTESEQEALAKNGELFRISPWEIRYQTEIEKMCESNKDYLYSQEKYRLNYDYYKRSVVLSQSLSKKYKNCLQNINRFESSIHIATSKIEEYQKKMQEYLKSFPSCD